MELSESNIWSFLWIPCSSELDSDLKNASVFFPNKDLETLLWKALINFAEECFEEESPFFGLAPQTCLGHNTMWVWYKVIANEQAEQRRLACEVASLMPRKVLWQAAKFSIMLKGDSLGILVALDFTCSFTWLLMTFVVNKRTFKVRTMSRNPTPATVYTMEM